MLANRFVGCADRFSEDKEIWKCCMRIFFLSQTFVPLLGCGCIIHPDSETYRDSLARPEKAGNGEKNIRYNKNLSCPLAF